MIHSLKIFFLKKFRLIAKSIGKIEIKIIHYIKFLEWKKIKNYKNLKIEEKFFQFDEKKNESYIPKKMLVCISFFFKEKRFSQLKKICNELINCADKLEIFILTNETNEEKIQLLNSEFKEINNYVNIFSVKDLGHPYLLTWSHYTFMKDKINDSSYTHFMYLEDDIFITKKNIIYWMKSRELLKEYNLIPQFLRIEKNDNDSQFYYTDIIKKINLNKMPKVHDAKKKIAYSNILYPYQGCYFFDRDLMLEHLNENSSSPDFVSNKFTVENFFIREKANIGLMYVNIPNGFFNRHVIPIILNDKIPHDSCMIRHLGENYTNDNSSIFGKINIKDIFV